MNGIGTSGGTQGTGGAMAGNGSIAASGFPAPAGYTAELSYIHAMVEELSRQLSDNKRVLDDVVTGVGRVRSRARTEQLGNEELIEGASEELQNQESNMDATISVLSEALETTTYAKDANAALLGQYAHVLAGMLKQFHEYKQKHVADVAAWHRSYRHQLAEARAENSRLRDQIWQMQERAGRANASLRAFRAAYDENPTRWDRRVADKALRQELRFWKRMAMPSVADDDLAYWSDDDDLVDPVEKKQYEQPIGLAAATALSSSILSSVSLTSSSGDLGDALEDLDDDNSLQEGELGDGTGQSPRIDGLAPGDEALTETTVSELGNGAVSKKDHSYQVSSTDTGSGGSTDLEGDGREEDDEENDDDDDGKDDEDVKLEFDESIGLEKSLPSRLPAVPQAPSSAPLPTSISLMGNLPDSSIPGNFDD
ncbi:MAG: hypothetical protein STHCBS139747_000101 [Sporothrix thermara]